MKPDFSDPRTENKKEVTFQEDEAACKIQTFWKEKRKKSEERQQKEIEDNTFKMSEQVSSSIHNLLTHIFIIFTFSIT